MSRSGSSLIRLFSAPRPRRRGGAAVALETFVQFTFAAIATTKHGSFAKNAWPLAASVSN